MNIEELLNKLDEMLESSWSLPLSGGKTVIDAEKVKVILGELREQLPQEVKQARAVVADRNHIIDEANKEAESIIRISEERAKSMINESEIVKEANQKAREMLDKAKTKSMDIHKAANEYVDDLMKRTDDVLTENLAEFRKARQSIKESRR